MPRGRPAEAPQDGTGRHGRGCRFTLKRPRVERLPRSRECRFRLSSPLRAPTSRLAGDADTIRGRRARYVAAPASTEEASALLRAAAALGLTVVPRGAGRLQHWGNPPDSCDLIVDTCRLDRIVEHVPADFTVTVQAGVRLRDLERELAPANQTVALFPPRPAYAGTVGGLIATNAAARTDTASARLATGSSASPRSARTARSSPAPTTPPWRAGPGHAAGRVVRRPRADHRGHLPAGADAAGVRRRIAEVRRS